MDSEVGMMKMRSPLKPSQACYHVIKECQNLLYTVEWITALEYCYGETNHLADYLTNVRVEQNTP